MKEENRKQHTGYLKEYVHFLPIYIKEKEAGITQLDYPYEYRKEQDRIGRSVSTLVLMGQLPETVDRMRHTIESEFKGLFVSGEPSGSPLPDLFFAFSLLISSGSAHKYPSFTV